MQTAESILYYPLGDSAFVIELGQHISETIHHKIIAIGNFLDEYSFDGFIEYVPAFTTVTVFYDPLITDYKTVEGLLKEMVQELNEQVDDVDAETITIPVLYGGPQGPDLTFVAKHTGFSETEIINIHTETEYMVHMIGFAPGFPYLGGMNEKIACPRKEMPAAKIAAGSVGIAGIQTGIYPIETPGGWQIIGQTPLKLFDVNKNPPALIKAGNKLRFISITEDEFDDLIEEQNGH